MNKDYNQRVDESYEDWQHRLLLGKAKGEVSLGWADICLLLDLPLGDKSIAEIAKGMLINEKAHERRKKEAEAHMRGSDSFTELENKELQFRRQKMQMQDQKRELNKEIREWARAEHIKEEVLAAVKEAAADQPICYAAPIKKTESGNDGVLLLSDWHFGQSTANSLNIYNTVEFEQRIEKLMTATIEYGKLHKIEKLHVFALGDLINGLIHVTTRISNTEDVIKQTTKAAETLANMLMTFAKEFPEVDAYFTRGNHERISANPKESLAGESFFDLLPWYIEARVNSFNNIHLIENIIDPEIASGKIRGHLCYAVHGHRDKPGKVVSNLSLLTKEIPEYVFMGHFHSCKEEDINGIEVIVNGSLCGTDQYALELRRTSKTSQKFLVFNNKGRLCTYNILLDAKEVSK